MVKASRPTPHSDKTVYVAWALWLVGMSEASIARAFLATGKIMRRKQIAGIVGRSPYTNRSAMSDAERQSALDDLLAVRFDDNGKPADGGLLDRIPMKIIPLRAAQRKTRST